LFTSLDAPVKRVAARDTWVGYSPGLENRILPQTEDLIATAEALLGY
jgi:2-oxoisovalerate dehydrogenase E1 component